MNTNQASREYDGTTIFFSYYFFFLLDVTESAVRVVEVIPAGLRNDLGDDFVSWQLLLLLLFSLYLG